MKAPTIRPGVETDVLARFIGHLAHLGYSDSTLRAYNSDLKPFVESLASLRIPLEVQAADWLNDIRPDMRASTFNRKVCAVRAFGQWMSNDKGFLDGYKTPRVAPGTSHPLPEGIDGVRTMLDACRRPHHRALVALCGLLGLRVSEARAVRVNDFNDDSGEIILTVQHGKGDKVRHVPVSMRTMVVLSPAIEAADGPDGLLVPMSDRGARQFLTNLARKVGIAKVVASHDLRHTFATAAYSKSKDIRAVQELLGHSSVETTQTYTGISMKAKRVAADV